MLKAGEGIYRQGKIELLEAHRTWEKRKLRIGQRVAFRHHIVGSKLRCHKDLSSLLYQKTEL